MTNEYLTIEDENGELRPLAKLWPAEDHGAMKSEYYKEDIDKFMKKAEKEGLKLVKVKITKVA